MHQHLAEEPRLFDMHYWVTNDPATLAKGLRAALDQTANDTIIPDTSPASDVGGATSSCW